MPKGRGGVNGSSGLQGCPVGGIPACGAGNRFSLATLWLEFLGFVSGSFFRPHLLSTIWPGSFLASFFPQLRVFNNFSASFLGSFGFVFGTFHFVFNNISGSFSKKGILFVP
ncbi:MAG TPA: hypothetical protein VNM47_03730, partial [Terriglobia bacterium]|nr:hypothetical protein [Terriglobia bacterium]